MLRNNALKLTKIRAIQQVKKMTALIDDIGETAIKNMVVGEELKTKSPLGCQMIMSKVPWSTTKGKDTNGDGKPDRKLRYEFDNSQSVIEFPLGFCPGADTKNFIDFDCQGQWGLVLKEWETITATYPESARDNLNYVTKQVHIVTDACISRDRSFSCSFCSFLFKIEQQQISYSSLKELKIDF